MDGGIYTREKCYICGKALKHDGGRKGCFCPDHPDVRAHSFAVKFPGGIYQRYQSYDAATQRLNYLRYEKGVRKGGFDPNDYRSLRPNSFTALAPKYLERKKQQGKKSLTKISYYINTAERYFGHTNIRDITGGMIDDYIYLLPCKSEKTRANHCAQLHDFWKWCLSRGGIITLAEFPTFPKVEYELKYRKIIDWEMQGQVLSKLKEISHHINPKICFGCDLLATYTALRPDDLRRVKENSLDDSGWLVIHNPTKKKNNFKTIRLHQDHLDQWRELQRTFPAMPDMPFFRHHGKVRGTTKENIVFGENMLYLWWKKACKEIGLEGVPLYPGTKHTTATETAKMLGSERALNASGLTNKAFERYCQVENNDAFEVVTEIRKRKMGEVIPLIRKAE